MLGFRRFMAFTTPFSQLRKRTLHHIITNVITKSDHTEPLKSTALGYNFTKGYAKKIDHQVATFEDVVESINKPEAAVIVDVRNPDEVKSSGQIPSSINIPLNDLQQALRMSEEEFKRNYHHSKPTQSDNIIFYCKSGKRATQATDMALVLGYSKSKKFLGSWDEWSSRQG